MLRILKALGVTIGVISCLAGVVWFGTTFPVAFLVTCGAVLVVSIFAMAYEALC